MKTKPSNDKNASLNLVSFVFLAPRARRVALAGDFNDWNPEAMPMYKGSDGAWYLSVLLITGRYEYRFVADGAWLDDPHAQERTTNAFGSANCVKTVSGQTNGMPVPRNDTQPAWQGRKLWTL